VILWKRDRVFSHPRTGALLDDVQQIHKAIWRPALRKSKVRYRNPYQTRHTYASRHVIQTVRQMHVAGYGGTWRLDLYANRTRFHLRFARFERLSFSFSMRFRSP
jgi:hypothetical protein